MPGPTPRGRTSLARTLGAALAGAFLLALAAGPGAPARAADVPFARDSARSEVVALINGERKAAGLKPLTVDLLLSSRAHDASFACPGGGSTPGRARDNAEHAGLSHELSGCPDRSILDVMPSWSYRALTGEILAYNYASSDLVAYHFGCPPGSTGFDCSGSGATLDVSQTAATAIRQWVDSPTHHAIMLGAYDRFGCGAWAGTGTTQYGTGGAFYACVFAKGGPASRLDTRAPSVKGVGVAADGAVAGAAAAGSSSIGRTAGSSQVAAATVPAGATVTVSSTVADSETLGRVAGWQVAVDGGVVVNVLGSGRIDAGRGSVRVEAAISTVGLAAGAHTVTIRARDMAGRWSATATATLVVAP
ncbi:MAG: CAP domain-containing protein [Chloroflexi bacterium]|jgi:uncharacterized protein YkwD|nr:CAP domain-containing protein [Chloroflexota bacterium]